MSFEQLDVDNQYKKAREKKESEATDRFFLEKQIQQKSFESKYQRQKTLSQEKPLEVSMDSNKA